MSIPALDLGTNYLSVFVPGHPAPQGSKRHVGGGVMAESSKKVKPWRSDIRSALLDPAGMPLRFFDGAVNVQLVFIMPRPLSAPKRTTPPATKKPDLDKLTRAVFDAIGSAGVWRDDSQVVGAVVSKRIAEIGETGGCRLTIAAVEAKQAAA
jgi:crossover junction endodeoxyribonuclease RusA